MTRRHGVAEDRRQRRDARNAELARQQVPLLGGAAAVCAVLAVVFGLGGGRDGAVVLLVLAAFFGFSTVATAWVNEVGPWTRDGREEPG